MGPVFDRGFLFTPTGLPSNGCSTDKFMMAWLVNRFATLTWLNGFNGLKRISWLFNSCSMFGGKQSKTWNASCRAVTLRLLRSRGVRRGHLFRTHQVVVGHRRLGGRLSRNLHLSEVFNVHRLGVFPRRTSLPPGAILGFRPNRRTVFGKNSSAPGVKIGQTNSLAPGPVRLVQPYLNRQRHPSDLLLPLRSTAHGVHLVLKFWPNTAPEPGGPWGPFMISIMSPVMDATSQSSASQCLRRFTHSSFRCVWGDGYRSVPKKCH